MTFAERHAADPPTRPRKGSPQATGIQVQEIPWALFNHITPSLIGCLGANCDIPP